MTWLKSAEIRGGGRWWSWFGERGTMYSFTEGRGWRKGAEITLLTSQEESCWRLEELASRSKDRRQGDEK